jgi:mRNA-degrading endonuclease RelE of RelBE toxin-antitoxin system
MDRRTRRGVVTVIDRVATDPDGGKALVGDLVGYWTVRALRGNYRVVYRIEGDVVVVIAVGRRLPGDDKDVYVELARLLAGHGERGT